MIHYILLKMDPACSLDEMEKLFYQCYPRIEDELEEVLNVDFCRNIVPGNDMDIMIKVQVLDREGLDKYKNHPIHKFFMKETSNFLISCVRFDCLESKF